MDPKAILLIIDRVLSPQPLAEEALGYILDLTMLVVTPGGHVRTQAEFQQLLASAGFELARVIRNGWTY